jgi:hypothetical protein
MNTKWNELRNLIQEARFEEEALSSQDSHLLSDAKRIRARYEKELEELEQTGLAPSLEEDDEEELGCGTESEPDGDEHV